MRNSAFSRLGLICALSMSVGPLGCGDDGSDPAAADAGDIGGMEDTTPSDEGGTQDTADDDSVLQDVAEPDAGQEPDSLDEGGADTGEGGDADAGGGPLELGIPQDCNPLSSTSECLYPHPSRFFQVPDPTAPSGVRTALRNDAISLPPGAPEFDFATFNEYDGHSPSAPFVVHLGRDIHPDQLVDLNNTVDSLAADAPIAVFHAVTGARVPLLTEMDLTFREPAYDGRHALLIRPMTPLDMGARYVVALTTDLVDANGDPLPTPPGFAALRDGVITDHTALESSREDYEGIFSLLAEQGYPRDKLMLAWDFQVASRDWVVGGILSMREKALEVTLGKGLGYTIDNVTKNPNENVLMLIEGTFEVPSFLDDKNKLNREPDGTVNTPTDTLWFPFSMVVPKRAEDGVPLPLVVFGHGIFGTGPGYLKGDIGINYIQPLAQEVGGIVVATNFIGLSGADQELIATSIVQDLDNIYVITDRLQQSLINNLTLIDVVRNKVQLDPQVALEEGKELLATETVYYGVSLGGIQGISLTAISDQITRTFAAVPGGAWSTMLPRSVVYTPFKAIVDTTYPDPLLHQIFFSLMQSKFDGSDGINLGTLIFRDPEPWAPADRRLVLLEAIGDCQVPNIVTRMVSRAIGLKQLTPSVEETFGLEPVPAPTSEPVLSQILMPDRLLEYTPPIDNTIPLEDNGTHSDAIVLPPAFEQLEIFFKTGVVEHKCSGPCDPN